MQIAQGTENSEEKPVQEPEVSTEAPSSNDETQAAESSLRSIKRFRLVRSKKRPWKGISFRFWSREKWNENQKMKEGGGGGEGRNA